MKFFTIALFFSVFFSLTLAQQDTWVYVPTPIDTTSCYLHCVEITSDSTIWIGGDRRLIMRQRWGSNQWEIISLTTPDSFVIITDFAFLNPAQGFLVKLDFFSPAGGRSPIWRWNGQTWAPVPLPQCCAYQRYFLRAIDIKDSFGIAVGENISPRSERPVIFKWNGSFWDTFPNPDLVRTDTTWFWEGVKVFSSNNFYVWGGGRCIELGAIFHYDENGWHCDLAVESCGSIYYVSFFSETEAWATADLRWSEDQPYLFHFNGYNWQPDNSTPSYYYYPLVYQTTNNEVWLFNQSYYAIKGYWHNWNQRYGISGGAFEQVAFLDPNNGWLVGGIPGEIRKVFRYFNAGAINEQSKLPFSSSLEPTLSLRQDPMIGKKIYDINGKLVANADQSGIYFVKNNKFQKIILIK